MLMLYLAIHIPRAIRAAFSHTLIIYNKFIILVY